MNQPSVDTQVYSRQVATTGASRLNDPKVVEGVLRGFLSSVLNQMGEVYAGRANRADMKRHLQRAALETSAIFYGETPGYEAFPWNSPDQLGKHLLKEYPKNLAKPEQAVAIVLMQLANGIIELVTEDMPTFMQEQMIEEQVRRATNKFLGVPT